MADYTIIADVSTHIVRHLRERMCPSPIPSPKDIEILSPADQNTDYILGLYLYDIQQEGEIAAPVFMRNRQMKLQRSPKPYALYYMLFINDSFQTGLKAPEVQKIIGRAAQIINDNAAVEPEVLQPWLSDPEPTIVVGFSKLALEDKVQIWQAVDKPYQISMFYRAAPILLSSEVMIDVPYVREAVFHVEVADTVMHTKEDPAGGERWE